MKLYQVDAFTARPFGGNPAAVCLLDGPRDDAWLAAVAAELNLSETAFALRQGRRWRLRWFTPSTEVSLCGHATLATAHALWSEGHAPDHEPLCFDTLSGELLARREGDRVVLDFPARPPEPCAAVPGLAQALGAKIAGSHSLPTGGHLEHLVELGDAATLRQLRPDLAAMQALGVPALTVTAPGDDPRYDFVSRFFAPGVGIDEDPVTGSAHCVLAPFWARRLGKTRLVGYQASARGGVVGCEWAGERVLLRGQAVTVLRGTLCV